MTLLPVYIVLDVAQHVTKGALVNETFAIRVIGGGVATSLTSTKRSRLDGMIQ